MDKLLNVDKMVQPVLNNPYIMAVIKITLILYAVQIAPKPPVALSKLFENSFVKILGLALILVFIQYDLQLAIIISVIYVLSFNMLSGRGPLESFSNYSKEYKPYGNFKLLEPKTVLYPGCDKVTIADLVRLFEGDNEKLQTTVQYSFNELMKRSLDKPAKETLMKIAYATGLPYNLSLDSEESAPYIATLLINYGYKVSDMCNAPQQ